MSSVHSPINSYTEYILRQVRYSKKFLWCYSSCVTQLVIVSVTQHELPTFQEITEMTYVRAVDDHGAL